MVTLLEPKDVEPRIAPFIEPRSDLLEMEPKAGYREWRFAMPSAGVKYYAFGPLAPAHGPSRRPIGAIRLIDERVILL